MADLSARPDKAASSGTATSLAELHRLCRDDYGSNADRRVQNHRDDAFLTAPATAEPSDLAVAISFGQRMLSDYGNVSHGEIFALSHAHGAITEALRILLRALGAEPNPMREAPGASRCPAAHPDDPTPCSGPITVTVLDAHNAGADGCEHHAARLLASLEGGRVYGLPDAPLGAAIRVFKTADGIRPFPWLTDAPRTEPSQLSHAENRRTDGEAR